MDKEKFLKYEEIRQSGETNMFNLNAIIELSDNELTKEDCYDIMSNYGEYSKRWL